MSRITAFLHRAEQHKCLNFPTCGRLTPVGPYCGPCDADILAASRRSFGTPLVDQGLVRS